VLGAGGNEIDPAEQILTSLGSDADDDDTEDSNEKPPLTSKWTASWKLRARLLFNLTHFRVPRRVQDVDVLPCTGK
jgi:hypothetical protein